MAGEGKWTYYLGGGSFRFSTRTLGWGGVLANGPPPPVMQRSRVGAEQGQRVVPLPCPNPPFTLAVVWKPSWQDWILHVLSETQHLVIKEG